MNVDFRCEHCGKLLCAPAHASEPVRCPHCQKSTAVPAILASLPRPKVNGAGVVPPAPPAPRELKSQAAPPPGEIVGLLETLMPFVISLFFHMGLILVTLFLTTTLIERKEAPKEIIVPGTAISASEEEAGGTLTPTERPSMQGGGGPSRFSKVTDSSARSTIIASGGGSGNARPGMGVIGIGTAVGGTGEGTGTGTGAGWFSGGAGGGAFFGMGPGRGGGGSLARHIVYVVDRSGSMLTTFDSVKNEMLTSIGQLDGAKQDFHVIIFSDGPPLEPVERRLVPGTPEYKAKAAAFLKDIQPGGGGMGEPPVLALRRAFEVLEKTGPGGKVIFLLTDSDFRDVDAVLDVIRSRNSKKDVHIFTFLYGDRPKVAEETMKKIAAENGGKYKFVSGEE